MIRCNSGVGTAGTAYVVARVIRPDRLVEYFYKIVIPVLGKIEIMMGQLRQFLVYSEIHEKGCRSDNPAFPVTLGIVPYIRIEQLVLYMLVVGCCQNYICENEAVTGRDPVCTASLYCNFIYSVIEKELH